MTGNREGSRIDLHVVWLLVLVAPLSFFILGLPWLLLPIVILPQGILLTHYRDEVRSGRNRAARAYVVANEVMILVVAGAAAGLAAFWSG